MDNNMDKNLDKMKELREIAQQADKDLNDEQKQKAILFLQGMLAATGAQPSRAAAIARMPLPVPMSSSEPRRQ